MTTLLHKRPSPLPTGTVTDTDCNVIGWARRKSQRARQTTPAMTRAYRGSSDHLRGRAVFYTAEVCVPGDTDLRAYLSLGTRYTSAAQAHRAVRHFHHCYPDAATFDRMADPYAARKLLTYCVGQWQVDHRDADGAAHPMNVWEA